MAKGNVYQKNVHLTWSVHEISLEFKKNHFYKWMKQRSARWSLCQMASMQKMHFNGRGFDYRSRKAQNYAYLTRFFYLYAIRYRIRYSIRYRSVGRVHLHEPLKDKRNEIAVLRMISIRLASMWILENFHVSYQVSLVPNKLLCKGSFIRT